MEALATSAAIELWEWPKFVRLRGAISAGSLGSVAWPKGLQRAHARHRAEDYTTGRPFSQRLVSEATQVILGVYWPASLQQQSHGWKFNQPIVGIVWPSSLKQLSFSNSIVGVV